MKKLCLLLLLSLPFHIAAAQDSLYATKESLKSKNRQQLDYGYQAGAAPGWTIHEGDTLELGKGSLPGGNFAFIYENPNNILIPSSGGRRVLLYLGSKYANRRVMLKTLGINGSRKVGFGVYGIVAVGGLVRYYVELDNAIEAGEVLPPEGLRNHVHSTAAPSAAPSTSVADELTKLKALLDGGVINQAEFDAQKKKLLNQ